MVKCTPPPPHQVTSLIMLSILCVLLLAFFMDVLTGKLQVWSDTIISHLPDADPGDGRSQVAKISTVSSATIVKKEK